MLYPGLPPGPIAEPELEEYFGRVRTAKHDYLFFVAEPGGTGRHAFARTYEEHLKNITRYHQAMSYGQSVKVFGFTNTGVKASAGRTGH